MRHLVQQIVYKCCIQLPKLNFRAEYNASSLENTQRSHSPDAINSIRRSATTASGNVAKPMTSVFYDVIRFLTVLGEFEPQNVVGHRVDPKKALPYVTTRVLRHRPWNSMDGLLQ